MRKKTIRYQGSFLNVYSRQVTLPNGVCTEIEYIQHPGAVLVIPFLTRSKLVMLRQYRAVAGAYIYELPAGTLEKGESPLRCAKREIVEETGYRSKKMVKLGCILPVPGYSTEIIHIFKAEALEKKEKNPERDEVIETSVWTRKEIKELFKKGDLIDAKTISALAMCGWV